MYPLKDNFAPGDTIRDVPAEWLNTLARFWNTLQVMGGTFDRNSSGRDCKINVAGIAAKAAQIIPEPWDIVKADGKAGKVWIRKGKVIHWDGADSDEYELSGDGAVDVLSDTESVTGFQLTAGERVISAKLTVPTGVELTLVEGAAIPVDTATAVYWPLYTLDWDSDNDKIKRVMRKRRGHIKQTIWQLLSGWDASKVQALDHDASGVLRWTDSEDC